MDTPPWLELTGVLSRGWLSAPASRLTALGLRVWDICGTDTVADTVRCCHVTLGHFGLVLRGDHRCANNSERAHTHPPIRGP
eukprot:6671415-Pyramimonas_sp.AAC.1